MYPRPMRLVAHRVHHATARVDGEPVAEMDAGFLLLVGFTPGDRADGLGRIADKVVHLRVFPDGDSLFGASLLDRGGEVMLVSKVPGQRLRGCAGRTRRDRGHQTGPRRRHTMVR